jgi:hypothetical protein
LKRSGALWLTPLGRGAGILLLPLLVSACSVASISNPFRSSEAAAPAATGPDGQLPELPGDRPPPSIPATSATVAPLEDGNFHCPQVVAWPHDRLLTVYASGGADAKDVVHRGEITRLVRECHLAAGRVMVKYGFAGRVMLGPKGRPGPVTMPFHVKVADAGRQVLANDGGSISTTVPAENPVGYFSVVKEISFPVAMGTRPQDYKVFVALGARQG